MKTPNIKFNLKFYDANDGEEVIRTLDDLREKCNLSDLYDYYESGVLGRWLSSIGQVETAEQVLALKAETDLRKRLEKMLQLLGIAIDEQSVADFMYVHKKQFEDRDGFPVQTDGHKNIPSFISLISDLLKTMDHVRGTFDGGSVADMQKAQDGYLCVIRNLLKYYEVAFVDFLHDVFNPSNENNSVVDLQLKLYYVLFSLWCNKRFREYFSGYFGLKVAWKNGMLHVKIGYFHGFDVKVQEHTPEMSEDQFCDEKFGWSL